jgi:hypothetical protein
MLLLTKCVHVLRQENPQAGLFVDSLNEGVPRRLWPTIINVTGSLLGGLTDVDGSLCNPTLRPNVSIRGLEHTGGYAALYLLQSIAFGTQRRTIINEQGALAKCCENCERSVTAPCGGRPFHDPAMSYHGSGEPRCCVRCAESPQKAGTCATIISRRELKLLGASRPDRLLIG